jgi:hypothetical protein
VYRRGTEAVETQRLPKGILPETGLPEKLPITSKSNDARHYTIDSSVRWYDTTRIDVLDVIDFIADPDVQEDIIRGFEQERRQDEEERVAAAAVAATVPYAELPTENSEQYDEGASMDSSISSKERLEKLVKRSRANDERELRSPKKHKAVPKNIQTKGAHALHHPTIHTTQGMTHGTGDRIGEQYASVEIPRKKSKIKGKATGPEQKKKSGVEKEAKPMVNIDRHATTKQKEFVLLIDGEHYNFAFVNQWAKAGQLTMDQANKHYYEVIYNKGRYIGTQTQPGSWPLMSRNDGKKIKDVEPDKFRLSTKDIEKYDKMPRVEITTTVEEDSITEDDKKMDHSERGVVERNADDEDHTDQDELDDHEV